MRGGARNTSGPKPDPMALRREYDRREWTRLPASGCTLDVPDWPEEFGKPTVPELSVWQRVWQSPQAIVWHNDQIRDTVAIYVRVMLDAAQPGAAATLITQFRQLSEQLLLTTPALRAARYFIEGGIEETFAEQDPDAAPVDRQTLAQTGTEDATSIMRRFQVVKPLDDDDDNGDPAADSE